MLVLLLSKTVRRLLALVVLAGLVVGAGVAAQVWWTARTDDVSPTDAIVVLGASQYDGRPSAVLRSRLDHARALLGAGVAPRILTVGGGQPGDRFTEAQAGEGYLVSKGVEARRVLAVDQGSNTLQSLQALEEVLSRRGWHSVTLVTDPWHSLRSRRMARDLGLAAVTSPTRSGPAVQSRATEVRYVLRETAAYVYYRTFGASVEKGPGAI